jgi:hypothetical protein
MKMDFPSQEKITAYLARHPRTSDVYKKEKGIHEAVAKAFANATYSLIEVQVGVQCTIENLYLKRGIDLISVGSTRRMIEMMSVSVVAALVDCVKENQLTLKK